MKMMYIVRGSEDGNIGVFGNKPMAWKCAMLYFANSEEELYTEVEDKKYFFENGYVSIDSKSDRISVDIEHIAYNHIYQ